MISSFSVRDIGKRLLDYFHIAHTYPLIGVDVPFLGNMTFDVILNFDFEGIIDFYASTTFTALCQFGIILFDFNFRLQIKWMYLHLQCDTYLG